MGEWPGSEVGERELEQLGQVVFRILICTPVSMDVSASVVEAGGFRLS